jgi:DNA invertase Pin-like site-specific DNA recombinase
MKIVAYYRVSTKKQITSFDVQRETIGQFAAAHSAVVIAEYREVESGRKRNRPQLSEALEHAKYAGAKLVVAKLDRLARDVNFMSNLMEAGVDFAICDFPQATPLLIHILSSIAQYEAQLIRDRTRDALKQKRRDGVQLGSHRPGHWKDRENRRLVGAMKGNQRSAVVRRATASERTQFFRSKIIELRENGQSYEEIAHELNVQSFTTPRGKQFTKSTICKILKLRNAN